MAEADKAGAWCIPDRAELEEEQAKLQAVFDEFGKEGIKPHIEQTLGEWKDVPLYIGVTGRSGVGKSSFINALRGLTSEDEGAAETGVTETTTTVQQFHVNNQLVVCDLPGVGTSTFSKATYFTDERIGFDKFDMFLILTADRFMEDDLWLAQGIKDRKKGFIFIRTKIDQDVQNEKKARKNFYKSNPDAIKDVITKIKINCEDNLKEFFSEREGPQRVFLIDSYEFKNPLYDFDSLTKQLIENIPSIKRDVFIMSFTAMTPHIIEAKEEVLRGRIWKQCVLSALGGAVPIPGVSLALDTGIVLNEAIFYREQLGLEDGKLQEVAGSIEVPWEAFKEATDLQSVAVTYTRDGILQYCSHLSNLEVAVSVHFIIPVIGSIIGGTAAYLSTKFSLESLLDMMVSDAKKLNEYITKQPMSTSVF